MKPTSNILEPGIISRAMSTIVLPIVFGGYAAFFFKKDSRNTQDYIIAIVLLFVGLVIVVNVKILDNKYENLLFRFKKKDVIYSSIKMKIRYLDTRGEKVAFIREEKIANVQPKYKKNLPSFPLKTDGEIIQDETTSVNGYFTFPTKQKVIFQRNEASLRENGVSIFSTILKNSYLEKSDFFAISVKNSCIFCSFEVVLPHPSQFVQYRLKKRMLTQLDKERNDTAYQRAKNPNIEAEWFEVMVANILKTHYFDKTSITVYLDNISTDEEYKIEWEIT